MAASKARSVDMRTVMKVLPLSTLGAPSAGIKNIERLIPKLRNLDPAGGQLLVTKQIQR